MDASDESSDLSTNSQCSVLLADNQTGDEYSNPEHVTSNGCSAESAKYYYAHAFTSPMDWESQEINNSHLQEKVMLLLIFVSEGHEFSCSNSIQFVKLELNHQPQKNLRRH